MRTWHGVLILAVLVAALWPIPYLACPTWNVTVVTADGKPMQDIKVRLIYQNYSAEGESHEVTMQTDSNGRASFPRQIGNASAARRALFVAKAALAGVHASFGRHAHVFAFGSGYEGSAITDGYITDWRGSPENMESRITIKKNHL